MLPSDRQSKGLRCYQYLDDFVKIAPTVVEAAPISFSRRYTKPSEYWCPLRSREANCNAEISGILIDSPSAIAWITSARMTGCQTLWQSPLGLYGKGNDFYVASLNQIDSGSHNVLVSISSGPWIMSVSILTVMAAPS